MTPEEHKLIMMMFMRQERRLEILRNVLKSREILQGDDLIAFDSALTQDVPANDELHLRIAKEYGHLGEIMGLEVWPESPDTPSQKS